MPSHDRRPLFHPAPSARIAPNSKSLPRTIWLNFGMDIARFIDGDIRHCVSLRISGSMTYPCPPATMTTCRPSGWAST